MTLIPAVLVLLVGSNVVIRAVDQWFNEPVDEILSSANQIAGDYYRERQQVVADQTSRIADLLSGADLASPMRSVRTQLTREINDRRVAIVRSIGWGAVLMGNWMWCQSWTLPHEHAPGMAARFGRSSGVTCGIWSGTPARIARRG